MPLFNLFLKTNTKIPMKMQDIISDLEKRRDSAQDQYKHQKSLEFPDIKAKEYSFGRLVAYDHALRLLKNITK